ncbi:butyrophilin subfamily 2 member A1-like [Trematomus bernacchii]|uniref:butyrophilin subfamily 2 member A1-like n=1 Tax=Trematomus bernacchii TaxID=40690 RepID=UPI00146C101A|nr:butyrophilin subfamily 2 member A1-like [Trematomus bernacchii]
MIRKLLIAQTMFILAAVGQPACRPSQPVEAVEGGSATVQCRLVNHTDLSSTTVEWNRGLTRQVHVYRSQRDDPDSQMLEYRDRTTLNHVDLTRGVVTLTISNVSLSNNGSYEVYLPQLEVRCSTLLTVGQHLVFRPSQPVEAVEGRNATLQCRLVNHTDVSKYTVQWNRGNGYVHFYRGQHDDPDSQMLQYRNRTTLNHGDLTRGVLTLTISNVSLSDNGSYEVFISETGPRCSTHLTVAAEKRIHVWKIVLCVLIPSAVVALVVVVVWILVERRVIRISKKGGDPGVDGEELKELRTGAAEGGEDQQKEGSEVKDHDNEPKEPSDEV